MVKNEAEIELLKGELSEKDKKIGALDKGLLFFMNKETEVEDAERVDSRIVSDTCTQTDAMVNEIKVSQELCDLSTQTDADVEIEVTVNDSVVQSEETHPVVLAEENESRDDIEDDA